MSEYMQGGVIADDDLDFSAPRQRERAHEAVGARAAVKSPALNIAIGVSAVVTVIGLGIIATPSVSVSFMVSLASPTSLPLMRTV